MKVARSRLQKAADAALRSFWVAVLPALLAVWVYRYMVPTRAAAHGTWAEPLAGAGEHPLALCAVLFSLFAVLMGYWRFWRTGPRHLTNLPVPAREPRRRWVVCAAIVLALVSLALLITRSFVDVHSVEGTAMLPTLEPDDVVVGTRLAYGGRSNDRASKPALPKRGDIVMFKNQVGLGQGASGILRVIGLPGDRISMRGGAPVINGWQTPVCLAATYTYPLSDDAIRGHLVVEFLGTGAHLALYDPSATGWPRTYEVKEGEVFVLGDHRANASDSRAMNNGSGGGVPLAALESRGHHWLIGKHRDGVTDFSRSFLLIDRQLHLDGINAIQAREAIERCLAMQPAQINPPETPAPSSQTAQGE